MKKIFCLLVFSLTMIACKDANKPSNVKKAEKPIKYGSNNGKYLAINGTKVYYEEYGNGTPLLLLHQGLGSIENLSGIIPLLSEHYRIIAVDAPGHGRSEQADSLSGELLADYCSKFIDALKLDSAYVMGWSMGGNTALLLAANRPDKIDRDWLQNYQAMNPQPEKWVKFWEDTQKMWSREIKVPDKKLSSIEIPVLIIRGDRDMIKLDHSVAIFQSLKNGQLCIYPNAGHEMPDEKADALCKIVIDFFDGGKINVGRH